MNRRAAYRASRTQLGEVEITHDRQHVEIEALKILVGLAIIQVVKVCVAVIHDMHTSDKIAGRCAIKRLVGPALSIADKTYTFASSKLVDCGLELPIDAISHDKDKYGSFTLGSFAGRLECRSRDVALPQMMLARPNDDIPNCRRRIHIGMKMGRTGAQNVRWTVSSFGFSKREPRLVARLESLCALSAGPGGIPLEIIFPPHFARPAQPEPKSSCIINRYDC